jgi:hypothetical protein
MKKKLTKNRKKKLKTKKRQLSVSLWTALCTAQ